jgi:hypothetical protein
VEGSSRGRIQVNCRGFGRKQSWQNPGELERVWKEAVVAESRCSPGVHLERLKNQQELTVSQRIAEPSTSVIK